MKRIERQEMTAGEVARVLGMTRQNVHYHVTAGNLKPIGRSVDGVYIFARAYIMEVKAERDAKNQSEAAQ